MRNSTNGLIVALLASAGVAAGCNGSSGGPNGSKSSSASTAPTTSKSTGSTTPVASGTTPAPVATSTTTTTASNAPARFLYSANLLDDSISQFKIDATTGALTAAGSSKLAAGSSPAVLVTDPAGKFLFSIDAADVAPFSIDATSGALTAIGSAPITTNLDSPWNGAVTPDGQLLVIADLGFKSGISSLVSFKIDATGKLTFGTSLPMPAGGGAASVTINPAGTFGFVTDINTGDVAGFTVESGTGAMAFVGTAPMLAHADGVAIDPTGKFVVAASDSDGTTDGNLQVYSVDATGALTAVGKPVKFGALGSSPAIRFSPDGKFVYAVDAANGDLFGASIDATGALTALAATTATGASPYSAAIDPSGKFGFTANSGDDTISVMTIDPATGAATAGTPAKDAPVNGGANTAPSGVVLVK